MVMAITYLKIVPLNSPNAPWGISPRGFGGKNQFLFCQVIGPSLFDSPVNLGQPLLMFVAITATNVKQRTEKRQKALKTGCLSLLRTVFLLERHACGILAMVAVKQLQLINSVLTD